MTDLRHFKFERELIQAGIGFHEHDDAFLAVDNMAALQAPPDRTLAVAHITAIKVLMPASIARSVGEC